MPKQVAKHIINTMKRHDFLRCKHMQNQCNTMSLKVLQVVRARTEQGIKKTLTMKPKSISKSITDRCENDARTSDAQMMENGANMESQREPTSRTICQKYM